ncbi:hypothetical protein B7435_07290 [Mycolicibacterium peregrinum]|uniref:hypothetical protein n=1 Tax=Mycolicibacterium peregrinum TaxID=43304 RepID=UPI000B4B9020|nr:hypothetical protein [Mycolicibacterium peregrinum]OWM07725.1 hypothetical protein B7435_07290 [Mycolicibacterium peregrinum]
MSRNGLPWAATSVPAVRHHWCNALQATVENHTRALDPDIAQSQSARLKRMQDKLSEVIDEMAAEAEALRAAEMYWVTRDMVDLVVDAAEGLPEWTPAIAAPSPNGLMCWAKPAGHVPYGAALKYDLDVPWDAVFWRTRPDGVMQIVPASRLTKNQELLEPFGVKTPLWAAHTLVLDPEAIRSEEATGSSEAHRFVSVVGAAWLLMGQSGVAGTRTIGDRAPATTDNSAAAKTPTAASTVTLIDLRRPADNGHDSKGKPTSGREFQQRWWVGPHWRQQPCGPGRTQRKPVFIAPYVKGPEDKPLVAKERVNVLRR